MKLKVKESETELKDKKEINEEVVFSSEEKQNIENKAEEIQKTKKVKKPDILNKAKGFSKKTNVETKEDNQNFNKEFDFLNKTQEDERLKLKGETVNVITQKRESEKLNLINFIHYYKFLSPILIKTNHINNPEVQAEHIYEYVSNANKFALLFMEELELHPKNPNYKWLINSLERLYIENYLNDELNFDFEFEKEKIKKLVILAKNNLLNENFIPFEFEETEDYQLKIEHSYLKHLNKVFSLYNTFGFYLEEKEVLEKTFEWLKLETKHWFLYKNKDNSLLLMKDKVIFYQSLLKEITLMLESVWKKEANNFVLEINELEEDKKEEWILNNPYDLKKLFQKTHDSLEQLFNLVSIVVSNK